MKRFYFDSSAYNKILDHRNRASMIPRIESAIVQGKCRILLSDLNLEEFLHTPDIERRGQLVCLARSICDAKLLPRHGDVILAEIAAYCLGKSVEFAQIQGSTDLDMILRKAVDKEWSNSMPQGLLTGGDERKKEFKHHRRRVQKAMKHVWDSHRGLSFEDFQQVALNDNTITKGVRSQFVLGLVWLLGRGWPFRLKGLEASITARILAFGSVPIQLVGYVLDRVFMSLLGKLPFSGKGFLVVDMNRLPGLKWWWRYYCRLIYNQHVRNTKPDLGDGMDRDHTVFLPYVDGFVVCDQGFADNINAIDPQYLAMSLDGFARAML